MGGGLRRVRRHDPGSDRHPAGRAPRFANDAAWKAYGERLNAFGEHLKRTYGITLAYHHHMGAYVESPDDIDKLMDLTDPAAPACCSTQAMPFTAAPPTPCLAEKHVARVVHVHCKDVRPM
jgi:inosose dehydratase